jgi:DivIVA domain-containing protein
MTISGESIRKIEFREGWRGYNQVDVDVFLEEVAAGVDDLHAALADARARAERAETRATAPGVTPETDETVRRTLTLAQRAADLVVGESKAVAERIVADATTQATRLQAEAASAAAAAAAAAQAEANAAIAKRTSEADIEHTHHLAALDSQRQTITAELERRRRELDDLRSLTAATRDRLRAALTDHLARLDQLDEGDHSSLPTIVVPDPFASASADTDDEPMVAALSD